MATPLPDSDGDLVLLALEGRQDAFSALYERYFPSVYDFLTRLLRSRDEAADVAQDTFIKALEQLHTLKNPDRFKSWLFTIAHRRGLNRIRSSKRTVSMGVDDEERASLAVADPDPSANPEQMASIQEAADIVWEAAAGLDPRTYAVMDLHVRQGLDSAEIAEVMGVTKGNAYTMVSRMKQSFSNTLATYLLVRKGRQDCDDLAGIVEPDVSKMTPELRRKADRHVAKCGVCSENRALFFEPVKLFAALMLVPVPAGLKAAIWGSVAAAGAGAAGGAAAATAATGSAAGSAGGGSAGGAGGATAAAGSQIGVLAGAAAAAIAVVAVVGGLWLANRSPDAAEVIAAAPAVDVPVGERVEPTVPTETVPSVADPESPEAVTSTTTTLAPSDGGAPGELDVVDDFVLIDEDTSVTIDVTANDGAVDARSVAVVTGPGHGTSRITSGGGITYTPAPDFAGSDRLTYSVADALGRVGRGVVRITVRQVNDPPSVPGPGVLTLAEDTSVTFDPMDGARDVDGDALTVTGFDLLSASGGRITEGATVYTPPADFFGSDSFSYTVSDGAVDVPVTVTVQVAPVPDRPVAPAGGVSGTGLEDTTSTVDLLSGWVDPDGDSLRIVAGTVSTSRGGTAVLASGGIATYTPAADFEGTDTVSYSVTDGVFTVAATATISVAGVNDAPTVQAATFTVDAGAAAGSSIGQVVASDRDAGDSLTYAITAGNTGGQIDISSEGTLLVSGITDASAFPLSLTVRVTDTGGLSDSATIVVALVDATGPIVSNFVAAPSVITSFQAPGVACPSGSSRSTLTAVVSDPSGVASVVFNYKGDVAGVPLSGSIPGTMSGNRANGSFAITITGLTFDEAIFDITLVATDGLGNTSIVGGVAITVLPCLAGGTGG